VKYRRSGKASRSV